METVVQNQLKDAKYLSLTTDIWTCTPNNSSFISLSAHWINSKEVTLKHVMLAMKYFPGQHTAEAIKEVLSSILEKWDIKNETVHAVIR